MSVLKETRCKKLSRDRIPSVGLLWWEFGRMWNVRSAHLFPAWLEKKKSYQVGLPKQKSSDTYGLFITYCFYKNSPVCPWLIKWQATQKDGTVLKCEKRSANELFSYDLAREVPSQLSTVSSWLRGATGWAGRRHGLTDKAEPTLNGVKP